VERTYSKEVALIIIHKLMNDVVEPIELDMVTETHEVVSMVYEMLVLLCHRVPVVNVIEKTFVEPPGGFS
jgi:hypothetical protein